MVLQKDQRSYVCVCVCIIASPPMPMLHKKHLFQDGTKMQNCGLKGIGMDLDVGCLRFSIPTQLNQCLAQEPPHKTYPFIYEYMNICI